MRLLRRLRALLSPGLEADLEAEMRHHREMQRAAGLSEREADHAFGNDLLLRERSRDAWGWTWLDRTAQDLRLALRQMRRAPGFAVLAILILALGIGANTALFSIVNAVLLRPLPYPHAERIVGIEGVNPGSGGTSTLTAAANYESGKVTLVGGGRAERLPATQVDSTFFQVLGVFPRGRAFTAAEQVPGHNHVVVISDALARRLGDRATVNPADVLGRTLRLNALSMTVIGVMPPGFDFPDQTQFWLPLPDPWNFNGQIISTDTIFWRNVARLRPGTTLAQARQEMLALAARPPNNLADARAFVAVTPLRRWLLGDVDPMLRLLLGAVGLVLLIACANVANLQLTRAVARQKEIAVRAALGAGRARLLRQNLTESLLLALLGGAGGLLLAAISLPALQMLLPAGLPLTAPIALDGRVLAYTAATALASGLLFGLFPTWHACNLELRPSLEGSSAAPERGWLRRARAGLAVAEVALALILLVGAALLLQSFARLTAVNPGFDPERLLTAQINPTQAANTADSAARIRFYDRVLSRIAALPGVAGAALSSNLPLAGPGYFEVGLDRRGPPVATESQPSARLGSVSLGYFRILHIPLLAGRDFVAADQPGATKVAILSHTLAVALWPGRNPLGQLVSIPPMPGRSPEWMTVVGVVGDTAQRWAEPPLPDLYMPLAQYLSPDVFLEVRAGGTAATLAPAIRRAVAAVDANEPVSDFETEQARIAASIAAPRFRTWLLCLFAALALLLSAAGIFTVMAFWTARRTAEIGIRMALGADPKAVLRLVVGQGLRLVAVGIALGLIGALALGHLLDHFLFHLSPRDPWTLAAAAALMAATGALACYAPARRAALLDPLAALRKE